MKNTTLKSPVILDFLCILLILCSNPIVYFFNKSPRLFSPDIYAYLTMADILLKKGLLYIPSWGHINTGLILPPLYPFLLSCAKLFIDGSLCVGEYVSSGCALVSLILCYFYIRKMTNRIIALITVELIQINYFYFLMGMSILTEACYLMTQSGALLLTLIYFKNEKIHQKRFAFGLGVAAAFVFLSRHIGISFIIFLGGFSLITYLFTTRKYYLKHFIAVAAGWVFIIFFYAAGLYLQTGQSIFTQSFQANNYRVNVTDVKDISEIKQIQKMPAEDYFSIKKKERALRKLLSDSSEMFGYVDLEVDNNETKENSGLLSKIPSFIYKPLFLYSPLTYFKRFFNNLLNLKHSIGVPMLCAFILFCFSPFIIRNEVDLRLTRLILPAYIGVYLLILSNFTDLIFRYVEAVFPYVIIHIMIESFICFRVLYKKIIPSRRKFVWVVLFLGYSSLFLTTPKFFNDLRLGSKYNELIYSELRSRLNGMPVFSLHPNSYLSGGSFRILPNDSLEKIVEYSKKTGVYWILVDRSKGMEYEFKLYNNAHWYWDAPLKEKYPDLLKYCCSIKKLNISLYRIIDPNQTQ